METMNGGTKNLIAIRAETICNLYIWRGRILPVSEMKGRYLIFNI